MPRSPEHPSVRTEFGQYPGARSACAPSRPLGPPPAPSSPSAAQWRVVPRRPVERWVIAFGDSHSLGLPATEIFTIHRPEGVKSRFSQLSRSHTRPKRPAITHPASRQVSSHPSPPASSLPSSRPVPASRHVAPLSLLLPPRPPHSLLPFRWHRSAGTDLLGTDRRAQSVGHSPNDGAPLALSIACASASAAPPDCSPCVPPPLSSPLQVAASDLTCGSRLPAALRFAVSLSPQSPSAVTLLSIRILPRRVFIRRPPASRRGSFLPTGPRNPFPSAAPGSLLPAKLRIEIRCFPD